MNVERSREYFNLNVMGRDGLVRDHCHALWVAEKTEIGLLDRHAPRLYALLLTLNHLPEHAELESRHEPGNIQSTTSRHNLLLLR